MAKSKWKFFKITENDIYNYIVEYKLPLKKKNQQSVGLTSKKLQINNINFMHRYLFHLGCQYTSKKFFGYAVGLKALQFLKFKKPFHFRSKKKKNI